MWDKYLLRKNGLEILLNMLLSTKSTHFIPAVQAFSHLAKQLRPLLKPFSTSRGDQTNPKSDCVAGLSVRPGDAVDSNDTCVGGKSRSKEETVSDKTIGSRTTGTCGAMYDLVFIMDDGNTVEAVRSLLKRNSEVFEAMLDGHYTEANSSRINISDTNSKAFSVLVRCLHGEPIKTCISTAVVDGSSSFELLLDILQLAHRYMTTNVYQNALTLIYEALPKEGNLEKIIHSSSFRCSSLLTCVCLVHLFASRTSLEKKCQVVSDISESFSLKEFTNDMKLILFESYK